MKEFNHIIKEEHNDFIPFNTDAPSDALINMKVDCNGNFWMICNKEGCLHLAKIFSEMALRDLSDGFHFHKDSNFKFNLDASAPSFSFGLINF